LGLLGLVTLGCGSEPEVTPWSVPMRSLPCGLEPLRCSSGVAVTPEPTDLVPPTAGFQRNVSADEYAGSVGPDCELGFVFEVPPEKLTGTALMIQSTWSDADVHARGLARCADYAASMHAYTPDASGADGYRLVDHRTFSADASEQSMRCEQHIDSAGPGEEQLPRNHHIWLTPKLYPDGLRIVFAAVEACAPLDLRFGVSQSYSSLDPDGTEEPSKPGEPSERAAE
jgi:hypothetical protein